MNYDFEAELSKHRSLASGPTGISPLCVNVRGGQRTGLITEGVKGFTHGNQFPRT